jgi:DNA replication protein DnaC
MTTTMTAEAQVDELVGLCRRLRLPYIRHQVDDVVRTAKAQRWDPAETVRVLLQAEADGRDTATAENRRRRARFPTGKTFDTWTPARSSIPTATQAGLRTLEWVTRRENLVIAGPSGTGKSHFCEALGHHAITNSLVVRWFSIEDLGALVRSHRVDDTIPKALKPILRADLIIIDDLGLLPVSPDAAEGLYRLIDTAYETRSLAVSSNLHPSGFGEIMDNTIAAPLVDRLLHHAHLIVTEGDSYRLTDALNGKGVTPLT